jgi:predicted transcriptional regulator
MPTSKQALTERTRRKQDVRRWQVDHIRQGIRDADAGRFATDLEVERTINRLLRRPKSRNPNAAQSGMKG